MRSFCNCDNLRLPTFLLAVPVLGLLVALSSAVAQEAPKKARENPTTTTKESKASGESAKEADKEGWVSLFDGKTLGKWKVVTEYDFQRHGKVVVKDNQIILEDGFAATGIKWSGDFPKINYEISLEAMRIEGDDFFCGLTFPVGDKWLTLICGGWGGQVTGLSNIDGDSAIDNETCTFQEYKEKQWYRIRVRVTKERISVWLDDEQVVDFEPEGRQLSIRWEVEPTQPLGICTWYTTGALKNLRWRPLDKKAAPAAQEKAKASE